MKINKIHARQILDSRGNPTIETDVVLENGIIGQAAVPSGASTGAHENVELRDKDNSVLTAVNNVNTELANLLIGSDAENQTELDQKMIALDGTTNKARLGANAILSVSLAVAKAAALNQKIPLYQYFGNIVGNSQFVLPLPMINIINGGKHANWATDIQEYMILPVGATTFHQALENSEEVFHQLSQVLKDYNYEITVGDEGGYAPRFKNGNKEPFELISQAIEKAGFKVGLDFVFGIDAAASEFFSEGKYVLKKDDVQLDTPEMIKWLTDFPVVSIEDGLDQNDWAGWAQLTKNLGGTHKIVGDDLFTTDPILIKKGIEQKAANAVIIKVNQIGTLTQTLEAVKTAKQTGWTPIISHRSGETKDTTISDLAVGLGTGFIKAGSVCRTDRVEKYNQLLRIEEELGSKAIFNNKIWQN